MWPTMVSKQFPGKKKTFVSEVTEKATQVLTIKLQMHTSDASEIYFGLFL